MKWIRSITLATAAGTIAAIVSVSGATSGSAASPTTTVPTTTVATTTVPELTSCPASGFIPTINPRHDVQLVQNEVAAAVPCQFVSTGVNSSGAITITVSPLTSSVESRVDAALSGQGFTYTVVEGKQPLFAANRQRDALVSSFLATNQLSGDEGFSFSVSEDGTVDVELVNLPAATVQAVTSAIANAVPPDQALLGGTQPSAIVTSTADPSYGPSDACSWPSGYSDPRCIGPDRAGDWRVTTTGSVRNFCTGGPILNSAFGKLGMYAGHCAGEQNDVVSDDIGYAVGNVAGCWTCYNANPGGTYNGDVATFTDTASSAYEGYLWTGSARQPISATVGGYPAAFGVEACETGLNHSASHNCSSSGANSSIIVNVNDTKGFVDNGKTYTIRYGYDTNNPYVVPGDSGGVSYQPFIDGANEVMGTNTITFSGGSFESNVAEVLGMTGGSILTCGCGL